MSGEIFDLHLDYGSRRQVLKTNIFSSGRKNKSLHACGIKMAVINALEGVIDF